MNISSGIILAGGVGSRLSPWNTLFNKHMIPLHNRFIIDYPLDTLKNLGVEDVTVVLGGAHFAQVVSHVKDGSHLGMKINYVYQDHPSGIAQAINLCQPFVKDSFVTVLGDNIFDQPIIFDSHQQIGAQIVLHNHPQLTRFGVAGIKNEKIVSIEEKPKVLNCQTDNFAITGCYLFDQQFFSFFQKIKPSARGEFEITDIINIYHQKNDLGYVYTSGIWSDAGTHESINFLNNYFFQK